MNSEKDTVGGWDAVGYMSVDAIFGLENKSKRRNGLTGGLIYCLRSKGKGRIIFLVLLKEV